MKRLAIPLVLLLLLPIVSAETFDPREVSYMEASYKEYGTLTANTNSGQVQYIKLSLLSFPRASEFMEVSDIKTTPALKLTEKDGIKSYTYQWADVTSGNYDFELSAQIKNSQNFPKIYKKVKFPFDVPADIAVYTKPTKKTESDDIAIKKTANGLILGETDAYKAVFKLADWVHNNVIYDTKYWDDTYSATYVLETKRGVCDEFSNLFIALARSVGIPARYVVGSAYTNAQDINDFQYHAWAEVWLPEYGWIPIDPTFGEYGWVDPTHIVTAISPAVETMSISYNWKGGTVTASDMKTNVQITKKENNLPNNINSKIWLEDDRVKPDSYNVVWAELSNPADFYISTDAWLAKSTEIIGENAQSVLLAPGEKKTVGWVIKVPRDLEKNYIYTYTIESDSIFSQSTAVKLEVDPRSSNYVGLAAAQNLVSDLKAGGSIGQARLSVSVEYPKMLYSGDLGSIILKIENSGTAPKESFEACFIGQCKTVYVGINSVANINFTVLENSLGAHEYEVIYMGQSQNVQINIQAKTFFIKLREFFEKLFGK
ncbi:MAG TPA: transglutaminase domain-containing protein [Nanoarchaeota archaeon]|nr:transglutaminase domain-containing protein [Nanoarchaeota archaeon]